MSDVTPHQIKRIRRANAADIARMVDQELYWSSGALEEILGRTEKLNQQNPPEALMAGRSALTLLKRVRNASPDLHGLALAVHAATLRHNYRIDEALEIYQRALAIKGLSKAGQGDVLARMAVTLVFHGQYERALEAVNTALTLVRDPIPVLAVRGWTQHYAGLLQASLDDALAVLERLQDAPQRQDYSLLSAITTCCSVLSYESAPTVDPAVFVRLEKAIAAYRANTPTRGSSYYTVQRPRLMLSRAEALMLIHTGKLEQAIAPLQRALKGLGTNYPDDAIAVSGDLICLHAKLGDQQAAVDAVESALRLLEHVCFPISPQVRNILKGSLQKEKISYAEAVELRALLRPQQTTF